MFINKSVDNKNNICGKNGAAFRKYLGISQRELADRLQLSGLDIDKKRRPAYRVGAMLAYELMRDLMGQKIADDRIEIFKLGMVYHCTRSKIICTLPSGAHSVVASYGAGKPTMRSICSCHSSHSSFAWR